jgi:exosortase/archaeosortase family protein
MAKKAKRANKSCRQPDRGWNISLPLPGILLFIVLVLVGNAPLWVFSNALIPYRAFLAGLVTVIIKMTGLYAVHKGVFIELAHEQWVMTPECTATGAIIVFAAFVAVYPASLRAKLIGLLAGIPFLFCANIVRLVTLAWLTDCCAPFAHWFHDYVWQVAFLALIAAMWVAWIEWIVKREKMADIPG